MGNFEPVERFQDWGDVLKFRGSGDGTGSSILDELKSIDILGCGVEVEGVAVVEFGVYERRSNGECARVGYSVAYASEVADVDETTLGN